MPRAVRALGAARAALAALSLAALLAGCAPAPREVDVVLFEDVTAASGLGGYRGMSFGAAWGDFDGDGRPDLYLTHHLNDAQLWRNLGGGRFADVTAQVLGAGQIGGDKHGAVWADFDNDGRLDLVQLTGAVLGVGAEPKRLFRQDADGRLVDVAPALGVDNPEGRARMPLWFDLDADGRLDLFQGAEARLDERTPPRLFQQGAASFTPADFALPLRVLGSPFCIVTELSGDNRPELVCRLLGQGAVQVFDLSSLPARSLELLPQTAFEDAAAADFDGDGRIDLFLARRNPAGTVALGRPGPQALIASVQIDRHAVGQPAGFDLRAAGPLQVRVAAPGPGGAGFGPQQIRLGAQAQPPAALEFEVGTGIGALAEPQPGAQAALHIGHTPPDRWQVRLTAAQAAVAGPPARAQHVQVEVRAAGPVQAVTAVGTQADEAAPARLFMNRGSGPMADEGERRGINLRALAAMNVVAADFDNDGHVDLFVLASGDAGRHDNLLLLNDGRGHFRPVRNAGGAGGSGPGVADAVATADFDGDGRLDVLIAYGHSMGRSAGLPSNGGHYQLLRNVAANGHHWLMIDLEGTRSNRDGIGAVVRVSAGGRTQVRVQDGGVHHRAQNHARLHFGLARHAQADQVTVHWPSGVVQQIDRVAANQVLRVREPEGQ
jgi:hypothetical protein